MLFLVTSSLPAFDNGKQKRLRKRRCGDLVLEDANVVSGLAITLEQVLRVTWYFVLCFVKPSRNQLVKPYFATLGIGAAWMHIV